MVLGDDRDRRRSSGQETRTRRSSAGPGRRHARQRGRDSRGLHVPTGGALLRSRRATTRTASFEYSPTRPSTLAGREPCASDRRTRSAATDNLAQSDDVRGQEAIILYADIYEFYHDTFEEIDAVLFYLGANLLQLGENDEARIFFEELAQQYPTSEFLAQAFLLLGELDFTEGNMESALEYYTAVAENAEGQLYYYALYKIAWCIYNIAQGEEDFEEGLNILYEVASGMEGEETTSAIRLRRDALRDMCLFYVEVGRADRAYDFFNEIAPDMAFDLTYRLARIVAERGNYEDANTLYRELIGLNSESFEIANYQREIVRNTRPAGSYEEIVLEVRRLVELFDIARGFEDADPGDVEDLAEDIERLLRQLATTYHREAQVTLDEELFALALELYEDYLILYPDGQHAYTMWFYYAEIQYWQYENWLEAARAYENALEHSDGSGQYDATAQLATCISYTNAISLEDIEITVENSSSADPEEDELPPIPEPRDIPDDMSRMMTACNAYQGDNVDETRAVEIQYAIAYTYYDYNHLSDAAEHFALIAMDYYEVDQNRATVSAQLLLDSLALMREFEEMNLWIDRLLEAPVGDDPSLRPRLELLQEQVQFSACRDDMQSGRNREAAECFVAFVESQYDPNDISELIDLALFNAGICFERVDELDRAISVYQYIPTLVPDSDLIPDTLYGLGQTYHRLAIYDEAANYYEQYVMEEGRDGEHSINALANAYQFRQGLGQFDQAIEDLETFIRASDEDDEVEREGIAEASFQIAMIQLERGYDDEAVDALNRFIRNHDEVLPGRAIEAYVHIADIYMEAERIDRAYENYEVCAGVRRKPRRRGIGGASEQRAGRRVRSRASMLGERVFERVRGGAARR